MALISLTPFGRGSVSAPATQIDAVYAVLRALSTAGLNHANFHPEAGIPEDYFAWDRHTHADSSLSDDCIGMRQLSKDAKVVFTHAPRTLVLFGTSLDTWLADGDTHWVDFATTSYAKQAFPSGVTPVVLFSASASALDHRFVLSSVTSEGFEIACAEMITSVAEIVDFFYIAIGSAPGILLRAGV